VAAEKGPKERILEAALKIVRKHGVRGLTQTRVAAAAGLRQSHLTYYFPHKSDLLAATLQASHARTPAGRPTPPRDTLDCLHSLMFDRNKMRFFLSSVIEASEHADLRATLAAHARGLTEELAPAFGRTADDPDVVAFVDMLRGLGLRLLLEGDQNRSQGIDLNALAARFGLVRSSRADDGEQGRRAPHLCI